MPVVVGSWPRASALPTVCFRASVTLRDQREGRTRALEFVVGPCERRVVSGTRMSDPFEVVQEEARQQMLEISAQLQRWHDLSQSSGAADAAEAVKLAAIGVRRRATCLNAEESMVLTAGPTAFLRRGGDRHDRYRFFSSYSCTLSSAPWDHTRVVLGLALRTRKTTDKRPTRRATIHIITSRSGVLHGRG